MAVDWQVERLETLEEIRALELLIRETESSLLAFALYSSISDREAAVRELKERLTLPVIECALSADKKNPLGFLEEAPRDTRACLFFYDLEDGLPEVTGYLNLQRESFAEVPHASVFWVREYGLREIATRAPDFWAWRSGVFDFRSAQLQPAISALRTALHEPFAFRDRGDLERRISLYRGLIREYSQQKEPDEGFLAGIHYRLGYAYYTLSRLEDAETCARESLELSRRSGNKAAEAAALHLMGTVLTERSRLDQAKGCIEQGLAISQQIGDEAGMASSFHNLGIIAQERQRFDEAEQWYRKALEIFERLKLERDAADEYHQLGIIAQERQQFDKAERWYRKALEVFERLKLEREAAASYHQLGRIAEEGEEFDEAEQWYRKALEIFERLKLEREASASYHQLGRIAEERQRFDAAEQWYCKALEIKERLKLEREAASDYHHLGIIGQKRQRFDDAEQWYRKALEIYERLELEREAASGYHQLGRIAEERQRFPEAEQWYRKALDTHERLAHPPFAVNTLAQLGVLYRKWGKSAEAVGWYGNALAIAAQYHMRAGGRILVELWSLLKIMGEPDFAAAWRRAFGTEPPLEALRDVGKQVENGTPNPPPSAAPTT